MSGLDERQVEVALRQMEVAALNFAYQFINIASVRSEYIRRTQEMSSSLRAAYRNGEMSARAAAEAAHGMRNTIMEQQRARSSSLGRSMAANLKARGVDLAPLMEKGAQSIFKKPFDQLDNAQQTRVYMEIVDSAGRARPSATRFAARAGAAGRALFVLGLGIAAYNIANANDPAWQTGREAAGIGGGFAGGAAGGAVAGLWFGPVGVAIGVVVGGVAGALIGDQAYVATVGASDQAAGAFLKRFTNIVSTDEAGIANALYAEKGMDLDAVHGVFLAMEESYSTDADDVAVLYLNKVFERGGTIQDALRLNRDLRETLIRVLESGWTTREEAALVARLRRL